jgi:DNA-binding beta-propeller fold protein YncE
MPTFGRLIAATVAGLTLAAAAQADTSQGLLETIHRHITRTSTITDNGDLNPYAVIVAPVSTGKIQKDDVLVDNFNNLSNLQGTGTTIVDYNPATKRASTLARLPQNLPQCPGGVGLTTAMTMLQSGWIVVGSTPSTDGTTRTKGPGCLIVLDANGQLATVWSGPNINGPWGNMAVVDRGSTATLFISMAGFDMPGPDVRDAKGYPVTINKATVLRLELSIPTGSPPQITNQTVIASGISARADRDVFLIGPTGLALAPDGTTLYLSDALANQIIAIPDATTRASSAGLGRQITRDGLLQRPLALAITPEGHLLACNAKNGQLVEIDPATSKQLYAQWIDTNSAQSPPGNGDLFGIAMTPDGRGFYYVEDDVNTLMEAVR